MKFDDRGLFTTNNYDKRGSLSSLVGVTNTNAESVTRNKFFEILVTLKTLATTLTYNVNIISNLRKLKSAATALTYNVNIISNLRKLKLLATTLTYNVNIISNIEKVLSGIKTLATTLTYTITTSSPSVFKAKFTGTSLNYNFTITSLAVKLGQLKELATSLVYNFNLPNNNIIKSKNVSAFVETSLEIFSNIEVNETLKRIGTELYYYFEIFSNPLKIYHKNLKTNLKYQFHISSTAYKISNQASFTLSAKSKTDFKASKLASFNKLPIDPKLPVNADVKSLRKHIYDLHRQYATIINDMVDFMNGNSNG